MYIIGYKITAFVVFVPTWIWCISEHGFLLGVGLGWLPSAIVALLVGSLWPLIVLGIAALAFIIDK